MSNVPELTIAGDNDLATDSARHAISSGIADPVYLWKSIHDPIVGTSPVVVMADPGERAGFVRAALDAGLDVVTLPVDDPDGSIEAAIADGRLKLISRLHGLPTLARLAADCRAGAPGRRYGIFSAHRLPRGFVGDVPAALDDLFVYVASLVDSPLVRLSATKTDSDESGPSVWFLLARFADDTLATIEVGALLPDADGPNGDLLVEVTGSDAVLRAEPERQSIVIKGNDGYQRQGWYADPPEFLLQQAMIALNDARTVSHVSAMQLIRRRHEAGSMDESLTISTP